jgi:hypothetical protein
LSRLSNRMERLEKRTWSSEKEAGLNEFGVIGRLEVISARDTYLTSVRIALAPYPSLEPRKVTRQYTGLSPVGNILSPHEGCCRFFFPSSSSLALLLYNHFSATHPPSRGMSVNVMPRELPERHVKLQNRMLFFSLPKESLLAVCSRFFAYQHTS